VSVLAIQNLTAEKLLAYEVGYRVAPARNLSFDVTGFYNVYEHLLVQVPNPTVIQTSPPRASAHLLHLYERGLWRYLRSRTVQSVARPGELETDGQL
jgi:hypothetical protein